MSSFDSLPRDSFEMDLFSINGKDYLGTGSPVDYNHGRGSVGDVIHSSLWTVGPTFITGNGKDVVNTKNHKLPNTLLIRSCGKTLLAVGYKSF